MTNYDKAKQIIQNGMNKKELFEFFGTAQRDIIDYIVLFGSLGVGQDEIWNLYEERQER